MQIPVHLARNRERILRSRGKELGSKLGQSNLFYAKFAVINEYDLSFDEYKEGDDYCKSWGFDSMVDAIDSVELGRVFNWFNGMNRVSNTDRFLITSCYRQGQPKLCTEA